MGCKWQAVAKALLIDRVRRWTFELKASNATSARLEEQVSLGTIWAKQRFRNNVITELMGLSIKHSWNRIYSAV